MDIFFNFLSIQGPACAVPFPKAALLRLAMHQAGPMVLQCPAQSTVTLAYKYMHIIICQISELMVVIYFMILM